MQQQRKNIREFAPMQEIVDSIYEMLERVKKLNPNNLDAFQAIEKRIISQTFCLMGVTEDREMRITKEYKRMIEFFETQKNKSNNRYVVQCVSKILEMLDQRPRIENHIQHKDVHPSRNMLTSFFRSSNHIDQRMNLAETNPSEYIRTSKAPILKDDSAKNRSKYGINYDTDDVMMSGYDCGSLPEASAKKKSSKKPTR
jgi:hypothetical protein